MRHLGSLKGERGKEFKVSVYLLSSNLTVLYEGKESERRGGEGRWCNVVRQVSYADEEKGEGGLKLGPLPSLFPL